MSYTLRVQALPLTISGHIAGGATGSAASGSYSSSGGVGSKTFAVVAGTFPTTGGLSSAGAALGNWSAAGSYSWTVRVTDSASPTPATTDISDSCTITAATLTLSGTFSSPTVIGASYSSNLTISGGVSPYSLHGGTGVSSGSLPAGLSLSIVGSTLTLSGTPTTWANNSFIISVDSTDS